MKPDDAGVVRGERCPVGYSPVHEAQRLVDPVVAQLRIHRRPQPNGQLGVDPVDQRLMDLATADEGNAMVIRPGPHPVLRCCGPQCGNELCTNRRAER